MNNDILTGRIFKYVTKLKMVITWIIETENGVKELQVIHEDITERIPIRNKLHNLKGFQENPEEKQEPFGLRKGERNTRKE